MSKGIYMEYIYTHIYICYIYIYTHTPKKYHISLILRPVLHFDIPELQMHLIITGMSYWKNF